MNWTTPVYRDYPIPIWESHPELITWWLLDGILIFVVLLIAYLPRLLSWIDEGAKTIPKYEIKIEEETEIEITAFIIAVLIIYFLILFTLKLAGVI